MEFQDSCFNTTPEKGYNFNMPDEKYIEMLEEIIEVPEYRPLFPSDLIALMNIPDEYADEARSVIEKMAREGKIALTKKGKVATLSSVGIVSGSYRGTTKHFGFVTPDDGGEDIFIPASKTLFALDGDKVLVRVTEHKSHDKHFDTRKLKRGKGKKLVPIPEDKRRDKGPEGEIVRINDRYLAHHNAIGVYYEIEEKRGRKYHTVGWVEPDRKKLPYSVFIDVRAARDAGVCIGDKVEAKITKFPSEREELSGEIIANFGDSETKSANYAAILAENGIETEFSEEVLSEAEKASEIPITAEGRLDLRDKIIFTIDGADAKDLDDAISLERDGENYRLGVHIADVSEYVKFGSATDKCALNRGTSVYFTDKVIPMLPKSLSNGACSLGGGLDRYALSAFMTLDKNGKILETELAETIIRSKVRGVYSEINDIFEKGNTSEFAEKYSEVLPTLWEMHSLYRVMKQRSEERGSVELDTEEAVILLGKNGEPVDIVARERGDGERMIEQFMLCANEGVATFLTNLSLPCVYRVHEAPAPEKLDNFAAFVQGVGLDIKPLRAKTLYPSAFAALLDESREKGISTVVSGVMLRAMMKAKYSAQPASHFGLAIDLYCHFTSPIRRYPDLTVHRIVKAMLRGEAHGSMLTRLTAFAGESAARSSENELKALSAEREIDDLYKAIYMSDKVGEEFDGVISSVTSFGLFVQLPNTIEGLVPLETMDGRFVFDEKQFTLSFGRTAYRLGQTVRVKIMSSDIPSRRISMTLI